MLKQLPIYKDLADHSCKEMERIHFMEESFQICDFLDSKQKHWCKGLGQDNKLLISKSKIKIQQEFEELQNGSFNKLIY